MRRRHLSIACILGLSLALAVLGIMRVQHPTTSAAAAATTRYVATTGTDTDNDCTTQITPCRTIQHAVDAADEGDVIKVAGGTYNDLHGRPRDDVTTTGTVTQVVYVSKTVAIRGGYAVTNWITPNEETNATILDAGGQGRAVYVTGDISPTIDGLRLTRGDATGLGGQTGQDAGGGVYVITAAATLMGNEIHHNFGGDGGGGICLYGTEGAIVHSNDIYSNTASLGGGVEVRVGQGITLSANRIHHNVAVDASGGGVASIASSISLENNVIADNQMESSGGALWLYVGNARLRHNTLARNVGGGGDDTGIYLAHHRPGWPATVALTNTILVGHEVGLYANNDCTATLESTLWGSGAWENGVTVEGDGTLITGSHNYWGDPDFHDPDAVDYHIGARSAAVDAGVATEVDTDIDGDDRPIGPQPDLGADEAWRQVYLPLTMRMP